MSMLNTSKIVIVGGSSGIGRGVAQAAVDRGAEVVLVGRSEAKLRRASEALGAGPRVTTVAADVTHEPDVVRMFEAVGPFDHLVVTRGVPPLNAPIDAFDLTAVRAFVDAMQISSITLAKHAQRTLRRGGSITFTSGISKDRPGPSGGAVVAAVAGSFDYLVRALAREIGPTRANVVSPGWVDTPMWDDLVGDAKHGLWEDLGRRLPAGRIATPADIAPAYLFLMESELTTGTTLHIDGGHALI